MFIAIPYILLVIFFFFQEYIERIGFLERKGVGIFNYFLLIIFFCFRGFIFTDVFNYYEYFRYVETLDYIIKNPSYLQEQWWEPGFVVYMSFFKTVCNNYFFYQFFDSLINLILLYKCLKWFDSNDSFSLMIFLTMNGMIMFFDLQRNIKSILLFFYAIRYIECCNWRRYYTILFIALLFHNTALIYFFFYPFAKTKLTRKSFLLFCCLSIFGGLVLSNFLKFFVVEGARLLPERLETLISAYLTDSALVGFISLGVLEKIIMITLLAVYFDKLFVGKYKIVIKAYVAYIVLYFSFFSVRIVSERMSMLFIFSYWIVVPKLINIQKKEYKLIFSLFILVYCILKMSLYSQPQDWYENLLFGPITSIEERQEIFREFLR